MATIAFATYDQRPDLTSDGEAVADRLLQRGVAVRPAVWDDPTVRWEDFDAVILRSTWDYHRKFDAFLAWLARLETLHVPLWNPAPLVRWNADKRYLRDLRDAGVAIVPTVWLDQHAPTTLAEVLAGEGWSEAVIKPRVSASAYQTWRATRASAAGHESRFREALGRSGLLVQPFMHGIVREGEWSLIFVGGAYSHAVLKRPRPGDFRVEVIEANGTIPPRWLVDQAAAAVAVAPTRPLYARVDGVVDGDRLRLMELELIEPWLFLASDPRGPARFAEAISASL
ncbi:MAG TPA: hypothetical protein VIC85_07270 [Ktedonobacterales bacterium]|jgi:hypothetical protein